MVDYCRPIRDKSLFHLDIHHVAPSGVLGSAFDLGYAL